MAKVPTLGRWELDLLRSVEHVVRLGRVRTARRGRLDLDEGSVALADDALVVNCAADGLKQRPRLPIWAPEVITLQPVRAGFPCFGAALVGLVEATRDDDAEKNRLCPPSTFGNSLTDWARMNVLGLRAPAPRTASEPDVKAWTDRVAINPARVPAEAASPSSTPSSPSWRRPCRRGSRGSTSSAPPAPEGRLVRADEPRPEAPEGLSVRGARASTLSPCRPRCFGTPPSRPATVVVATPRESCSTRAGSTTPRCRASPPTSATPRPPSSSRATTSRTSTTSGSSRRSRRCPSAGTRRSRPASRWSSGTRPRSWCSTPRRASSRSTPSAPTAGWWPS